MQLFLSLGWWTPLKPWVYRVGPKLTYGLEGRIRGAGLGGLQGAKGTGPMPRCQVGAGLSRTSVVVGHATAPPRTQLISKRDSVAM